MSLSLLRVLSLLCFFQLTLGSVNVVIDDTFGDNSTTAKIQYSPVDSWNIGGPCPTCVDPSLTLDNTWHIGTFSSHKGPNPNTPLTATVPFFGSQVQVYCILSNLDRSDMVFYIDSEQVGEFTLEASGIGPNPNFTYNVPVFSAETLTKTNHTLTIQNGRAGGQRATLLLDYIIYTLDDNDGASAAANAMAADPTLNSSTPSISTGQSGDGNMVSSATSSHPSAASIAGAVIGTLLGVLVIGIAFFVWRRYYRYPKVLPMTSEPKRPSWYERFTASAARLRQKNHSRSSSFDPNRLVARLPVAQPQPQQTSQHRPAPLTVPRTSQRGLPVIDPPPRAGGTSTPVPLLAPSPAPSSHLSSFKIESIQAWQRQTLRESPQVASPQLPDMSEELSSYYEENPTESHRVRTPPPPVRHFTVMNN